MSEYKSYRDRIKNKKTGITLAILAAAVLACVAITFFIIYQSGYRYLKISDDAKFLGNVDKDGVPESGTVYYADGTKAELNGADSSLTYTDGNVYQGEINFETMKRNGQGVMLYKNGDRYEGVFVEDIIEGQGTYRWASGDSYTGSFQGGLKDGYGVYTWISGASYEGEYQSGRRNGYGKYVYADGTVYEGTYLDDIKQGTGKMTFSNGDVYEGDFQEDVRTGNGKLVFANGDTYEGGFLNNQLYGYGKYQWAATGRVFEGYFENGRIVQIGEDTDTPPAE